ncbi:MAG: hypothetical protein E7191_07990 [Erysipelotrichaceae bacterium]|nr:hypothetical protein [Erysipelotrichaceae bacterium]MBQ9987388.1 hypothetical protein [Erysipelotrichales bacterium]MBR3693282.1 hypothetical protein [Erysipelotrichales bacterium]
MVVLAVILLFILGIAEIFYPEEMWELEHYFDVRGGEPTEFYLLRARITGVISLLISLGITFYFLIDLIF